MKKIFTLAIAALAALGVNAQTVETMDLGFDTYPWNYSVVQGTDLLLTFNSQWGEIGLIGSSNAINPADYKGYKIEYEAFPETASATDGYIHANIADKQYNDFATDATVMEQDFNDDVKALASITKFNIQSKTANTKIHIKSFTLVKADGTEEAVTKAAAGGWGYASPVPTAYADVTYTGQYGGIQIVNADGTAPVYSHETDKDKTYNYTIELNEPLAAPITVELDDATAGFAYFNFEAGAKKLEFTVSDATAVQTAEDGTTTPKDVAKIFLKSMSESGYPFTVSVKGITRTLSGTAGIENINSNAKVDANAPMYNLAGQRVNKSYKGVVIQNGRKFMNNK